MSNTTNIILPLLEAAQAQKHVTVNETLLKLDALLMLAPKSATTSAEPAVPADGDVYILPAGKTGTHWGAAANHAIAHYRDGVWQFYAPREGFCAYVKDTDLLKIFDGSAWTTFSGGGGGGSGALRGVVEGRLSLASATPVMTADQTAKTAVYFTLYGGNEIGLYDGANWALINFAEAQIKLTDTQNGTTTNASAIVTGLTDTSQFIVGMEVSGTGIAGGSTIASIDSATQITLSANATASGTVALTFKVPANTNLDLFGFNASGALKLEMVKWTNDTTRATALTTQNGVYVKSGAATRRYLGSVRTTATAGQTEWKLGASAAGGGAASLLVYNYYNRLPVRALVRDSTASWTYASATWRAANNSPANRAGFVVGLAEELLFASWYSFVTVGSGILAAVSLGLDSTTARANEATSPYAYNVAYDDGVLTQAVIAQAAGFHYVQALESVSGGTAMFYGGSGGVGRYNALTFEMNM